MARPIEDKEYWLQMEIDLRSRLVTLHLSTVHGLGISAAIKAVREDSTVRQLIREYSKLSQKLDDDYTSIERH